MLVSKMIEIITLQSLRFKFLDFFCRKLMVYCRKRIGTCALGGCSLHGIRIFHLGSIGMMAVLLTYDYFPALPLSQLFPKQAMFWIIIGLYVIGIIIGRRYRVSQKEAFKWRVASGLSILFIVSLFTGLGGQSASGVSFQNEFFLLVVIIELVDLIVQRSKLKAQNA